jgi:hypothetical protein
MRVTLSESEIFQAAMIGVMRQCFAIRARLNGAYGADEANAWSKHIDGCMGEQAVSKFFNLHWDGTVGSLISKDVGRFQVRATVYSNGQLRVHPPDNDDDIFILVIGHPPTLDVVGWCYGREGKLEKFWSDRFNNGRPAFWVPPAELRPMEMLTTENDDDGH